MRTQKHTRLIAQLLVVLALALVIIFYFNQNKKPAEQPVNGSQPVSNQSGQPDDSEKTAPDTPLEVSEVWEQGELFSDDGKTLCDYYMVYPSVAGGKQDVAPAINQYYMDYYVNTMLKNRQAIADQASQDLANFPDGLPPAAYSYTHEFEVHSSQGRFLTISIIETIFMGGPHGDTAIRYDNFDKETGERFTDYDSLFSVPREIWQKRLADCIAAQIAADDTMKNGYLVQDAEGIAGYIAELPGFGLSASSISVTFRQGDIAPYSEGVPDFTIPFSDITDILA